MHSLTIRDCRPDDLSAITAIYDHYVQTSVATFEKESPGHDEMVARCKAIMANGYPWLVAERDSRLVGYAYASAYRPRPAYRHTVEDSVYVEPELRAQGIGTRLLDELVRQCTERNFRQMIAVIADRSPASVRLHARAGFTEAGTLEEVGCKFGRWIGTTLMQRALRPAS